MKPLVSAITGTYNRVDLVEELIENVRGQTYRPLEHCIVSDGPDSVLREKIKKLKNTDVPIKFVELGRRWSGFLAASLSAVPFQVAQWLASGDYLMWLADDERMEPNHVEKLVHLAETTNSDFVYSKTKIWFAPHLGKPEQIVIGTNPPRHGQITHALYRAELLDYKGFETHVGSGTDWDQVSAWMQNGARWAMLNEDTISHRVDKLGEGSEFRIDRQPLRGHA